MLEARAQCAQLGRHPVSRDLRSRPPSAGPPVTERDPHLSVGDPDVVDGEACDPVQRLGVEQDQQCGDPVHQVHVSAGVDAPDEHEPFPRADRRGHALGGWRQLQARQPASLDGPAQERTQPGLIDVAGLGEPVVQVVLAALGQRDAAVAEVLEEQRCHAQVAAGDLVAVVPDRAVAAVARSWRRTCQVA